MATRNLGNRGTRLISLSHNPKLSAGQPNRIAGASSGKP
jgi:hypothetical protein